MPPLLAPPDWLHYFQDNSADPALPWDDPYRLTPAERTAVIASIQQFQLGENAEGRRLLERADALAREPGGAEYAQALRLFIKEEQRHSYMLARFLRIHGVACLRHHWVHTVFRKLRGLAGLEARMRVLCTAEILAIPYYKALRMATRSPLLHAICGRILQEEAAHLRFQAFTYRWLSGGRPAQFDNLAAALHRWFLLGTMWLVWREHRSVFQAAGYSLERVRRDTLRAFGVIGGEPRITRS